MFSGRKDTEVGSSLVEAAIVFPVLALFIFGIIQFGYILSSHITMANAAAVGARAGVVAGTPAAIPAAAQTAVAQAIQPMLPVTALTVNVMTTPIAVGSITVQRVTVETHYALPLIADYPGIVSGTYQLNATSTMQ